MSVFSDAESALLAKGNLAWLATIGRSRDAVRRARLALRVRVGRDRH
jgi:hypothetical protein